MSIRDEISKSIAANMAKMRDDTIIDAIRYRTGDPSITVSSISAGDFTRTVEPGGAEVIFYKGEPIMKLWAATAELVTEDGLVHKMELKQEFKVY